MGTRNLTVVKARGEYRIAQYGQWDGYPTGQGQTIVKFLRGMNKENFINKCVALQFYTPEEMRAIPNENWERDYPQLNRDLGGKILQFVNDAPDGLRLHNDLKFAGDSLFCEWAYVIDFDLNVLEVYRGFNKAELAPTERFCGFSLGRETRNKEYQPIFLLKSYSLDQLPTNEDLAALEKSVYEGEAE